MTQTVHQTRTEQAQGSPDNLAQERGVGMNSIGSFPEGTQLGHFTKAEKIKRLLWNIVQGTLFRFSPRRADRWRASLLRLFGAQIGQISLIRSTVRVEVPWNLAIGDGAQIGDKVYLYSLGPITIGASTVISQFVHICAGTHDFERSDFPLLRVPIVIGDRCWIATETFVGPGVRIHDGVVIGARSNVIKDLPEWTICVGCPAKPIGPRRMIDVSTNLRLDPHDPHDPHDHHDAQHQEQPSGEQK